jgi:hypothetical protein
VVSQGAALSRALENRPQKRAYFGLKTPHFGLILVDF